MKRIILICLSIVMLIGVFVNTAGASDVMPCFNNTSSVIDSFGINSNGKATVAVDYSGYTSSSATITVKLQKKFLIFFWKDVDIGQPDNTWTDYVYGTDFTKEYTHYLSDTGKYRAIITYTVSGVGGPDDVIEHTHEDEY